MDSTFISADVQHMWSVWNIRGFMILSLCTQLVLALTAPFRRKTSNGFFIIVVWSAFLLADWIALFAFGLISNAARCKNSNNNAEVAPDVMAFWAAFLLIHLGGPDTITAFSLEDNALWLRHLVELIGQVLVFLYIFVKTLPHNKLLVPATLIFVAGVIKYGERTRALYLASLENLKKSFKKTRIVNLCHGVDNLHQISKGLIVDITPDLSKRNKIRKYLLSEDHSVTLNLIFLELRLLYEILYTKIKGLDSKWGIVARDIARYSVLVAFILFCLADKQELHGIDIAITYALLGGVFIVNTSDLLMLSTTKIHGGMTSKEFILWNFERSFLPLIGVLALNSVRSSLGRNSAIGGFLDRQWSTKMGSFILLSHRFKQFAMTQCQKPAIAGFIWNKLAEMIHTSREDFDPELFNFVLEDLKKKTEGTFDKERMRKVYEARGDWALEERGCKLKPFINLEYDRTLFIWHVATEILYNIEGDVVVDADKKKRLSKVLSDYMMYLLVRQPKLMSPVAGITHIRYEDTCVELKLLKRKFGFSKMSTFCQQLLAEYPDITEPTDEEHDDITEPTDEEQADITEPTDEILEEHVDITEPTDEGHHCAHPVLKDLCRLVQLIREQNIRLKVTFNARMDEPTDEGHHCAHSVLKDSCSLVHLMREENIGWEVIFNVWMELLSYAASHCRADSHARLLSEGGEFITIVWMLMVYLGVGA